ncbi:hypothetical protein N7532_001239 [Penicillium argentinense]|uniref:Uncharacterized protein n=1 Tax=Penicillium argentinense TaxID=1131581 RepID=A0A9W9G236_9EURO|nr:uncharacterized protein N7532_001239 [Penicillium argentinense]KAJ5110704.1 hypothetical protein N7532_001239 [Penicillium argentinense]
MWARRGATRVIPHSEEERRNAQREGITDIRDVAIKDIRGKEHEFTLDVQGFQFVKHQDARSLTRNGLTPFEHFHPAPPDERSWGPKLSGQVIQRKIDFEAGASTIPAGIPMDIGALYRYSNKNGFGAILMTESPENSETILRKWPDVRDNGLIIVTSTHRTRLAMMNAWAEQEKEISVGFRAGVSEIGEVAPSSTWYISHGEAGWVSTEASEPDDRKVVFFAGLYFRYRRLAAILPPAHAFRSESVEKARFRDVDPEAKEFRVVEKDGDTSYEMVVTRGGVR